MQRAYSVLTIKAADDDKRTITGIATTPTPDRIGDIVEPLGVTFKNPLRLLWHHDSRLPIGNARLAKPTEDGIEFTAHLPHVTEPGPLKDRIDTAWGEIKHGLMRGISIGFRALEHAIMDDGGIRFIKSEILELSVVAIPANAEATITTIKSLDTERRAALGREPVRVDPPAGASASRQIKRPEGNMTTRSLAEQISAFETKRAEKVTRMDEIQNAAVADSRSKNEGERDEFDGLSRDVEAIDEELKDLRRMEAIKAATAKPVKPTADPADTAATRGPTSSIIVKTPPKLAPGVGFARIVKVAILANKTRYREDQIAESMYGADSEVAQFYKAAVPAGTTLSGNWAANLISAEGAEAAAFLEYLRPATILGKFGTGNVPSLNTVQFRHPLVSQTQGGAAWWVGEGAPKPVTKFNFARDSVPPTKLANICVLSMEHIRDSSPKSDTIIRDQLRAEISKEQDLAFITPSNAGTANIKPASITNGAPTIVSTGDDESAVKLDVRSLMAKFTGANNPPSQGVWIMHSQAAAALGTMTNALGQSSFPGMTDFSGGTFFMMPVIVSDHVARDIVVLVNAKDIFLAQEDGIQIDASDQVSIQMDDAPTVSSATPTPTTLVSMWQTNSVAFRAEHAIGWKRGRSSAVAYLTSVDWGGAVHTV